MTIEPLLDEPSNSTGRSPQAARPTRPCRGSHPVRPRQASRDEDDPKRPTPKPAPRRMPGMLGRPSPSAGANPSPLATPRGTDPIDGNRSETKRARSSPPGDGSSGRSARRSAIACDTLTSASSRPECRGHRPAEPVLVEEIRSAFAGNPFFARKAPRPGSRSRIDVATEFPRIRRFCANIRRGVGVCQVQEASENGGRPVRL